MSSPSREISQNILIESRTRFHPRQFLPQSVMEKIHKQEPVVYYGHHKCGSTWLTSLCENFAREMGVPCLNFPLTPEQVGVDLAGRPDRFGDFLEKFKSSILIDRNARWDHIQLLGRFSGVHVIRDPRDILVSAYFSHRYSHPTDVWPELVERRSILNQLSKEDGMIAEIGFLQSDFGDMDNWKYGQTGIHEMKYEDLVSDPYGGILDFAGRLGLVSNETYSASARICDSLRCVTNKVGRRLMRDFRGLRQGDRKIPAERVLGIAHENRFEKMASGRKPGEENVNSHFRKGTPGDWKDHFTPKVREKFKQQYADLVAKLGYDSPDNW